MKKTLIIFVLFTSLCACSNPSFKTGDIIFHTSKSSQSKLLQDITKSKYTHTGIIFFKNGKPYVFEAVNPVSITSLDNFIKRGVNSKYSVLRYKNGLSDSDINLMLKYGKSQLGKSYDIKFQWSDKKMYCSEIIWKMFNTIGVELCDIKEFKDFYLSNDNTQNEIKKRYGSSFDPNEKVVAPVDLYKSKKLYKVYSNY